MSAATSAVFDVRRKAIATPTIRSDDAPAKTVSDYGAEHSAFIQKPQANIPSWSERNQRG
ncbi:hypothetical protein [Methylocystis sp. B8]|uniref:hypothetical protein n=1 Tax=Methylocystis sp. B8 TaxID=544938 RepID=UPI001FEEE00D|nr:hypothetical protein [Methylocystis sp. B8]